MSDLLGEAEACARLGVDAWALERLIEAGELHAALIDADAPPGDRRFDQRALDAFSRQRRLRRDEALNALADLDGPHLGGAQ